MGGKVLVLAKALEIERLAVQKHLCAPHLNAAHTKGLVVDICPAGGMQGVQVGRAGSGLPEMHFRDGDRAFCTLGACNGVAVSIQHRDTDRRAAGGFYRVLHRAVHGGHYGHILDVLFRGGVEHHRAMDARIVEKVKVGAVLGCGGTLGSLHTGDTRVVRAKEGQLPVLVAHRQGDLALIPHPAVVAAQGGGLVVLVVVAGRYRDGLGVRQGLCGVELGFRAAAQRKRPCAVKAQLQARFILFRI